MAEAIGSPDLPALARTAVLPDLEGSGSLRLPPKFLTIVAKKSSINLSKRKFKGVILDEPEEMAERAERETQEVQVPVAEDADPKVRFEAAAALYTAWAQALCESIDHYRYGDTKNEIEGVVTGLEVRSAEILAQNKDRLALLDDLWSFCVDKDDTLSSVVRERTLGQRVIEACASWKKRGQEALAAVEEKALQGMTEEDREHLERKLEEALAAHEGEGEGEGEEGEGEEEEEGGHEEEEGEGGQEEEEVAAAESKEDDEEAKKRKQEELAQMEHRAAAVEAERLKLQREREEKRAQEGTPLLSRMSVRLENERKQALQEAIEIAESPRIIEESIQFVEAREREEEIAKATEDEALKHRKEIESLAARNEGVAKRLAELTKDGAEEEGGGGGATTAEHRVEIEKLKSEGESLKARMARLAEERAAAENVAQSDARRELELMREQQKGKTKTKAKTVLTPEQKMELHSLQRDEIERMRTERQALTRKIGSDMLSAAAAAAASTASSMSIDSSGIGGDVAEKFLSEAKLREQERLNELLTKMEKEDIVLSNDLSNILNSLERKVQDAEEEKRRFELHAEELEKKRQQRSRMRDDQTSLRQKREEEKRKEQEEYARWQQEREKKMDDRRKAREIKAKASRGELPKIRVAVIGPKSGKTALVKRFLEDAFVENTTDTAIEHTYEKPWTLKGEDCLLEVLDTTGMEEFAPFRKNWYASCDGFLVVFDLTRKPSRSFKKIRKFGESLKEAKNVTDLTTLTLVLAGNKDDLFEQRKVKAGEAVAFAKEIGARYVEVSAKSGENVNAAFETLVSALLEKKKSEVK